MMDMKCFDVIPIKVWDLVYWFVIVAFTME